MGSDQSSASQKQSLIVPVSGIATWYYCSNNNPFVDKDKRTWEPYGEQDNSTIEKAFQEKKTRAVIGLYEVIFGDIMMQVRIGDKHRQRPVKREISQEPRGIFREQRFLTELPKPVPPSSYDHPHPEWIKKWMDDNAQILQAFQLDEYGNIVSDLNNNLQEVIKLTMEGIFKEAEGLGKQDGALKIIRKLQERLTENPEDALKLLVAAYANESFLYYVLNTVSQKEDDAQINSLGPFCYLLNIFLYESCRTNQESSLLYKGLVYRCASLTPQDLEEYHKNVSASIRWNGFVSTTQNKKKAEQWGNTLFIIDLTGDSEAGYGVDISGLSPFKLSEQEVLLPAGSIYTIQKIENEAEKVLIFLKRTDQLGDTSRYLYSLREELNEKPFNISKMPRINEEWDNEDMKFNTLRVYRQSAFMKRNIEAVLIISATYDFSRCPESSRTFYHRKPVPIGNEMVYLGEWSEETKKPEGRGIIVWKNGRIYEGSISSLHNKGVGRTFTEDGSIYEGEFLNLIPHGRGTYTWSYMSARPGETYEGDIKGGMAEGEATHKYRSGDVYKGQWKEGEKNGQGEMSYKCGRKYKGGWVKNKKHGVGIYTWANNKVYVGEFKDGFINGKGVMTYPNGKRSEGAFEKGIFVNS